MKGLIFESIPFAAVIKDAGPSREVLDKAFERAFQSETAMSWRRLKLLQKFSFSGFASPFPGYASKD